MIGLQQKFATPIILKTLPLALNFLALIVDIPIRLVVQFSPYPIVIFYNMGMRFTLKKSNHNRVKSLYDWKLTLFRLGEG